MPGSLWEATASETASFPRLDASIPSTVLVIGAGYSGLSTAIALADRGVSVVVLDSHQPGFGASGRNGGIVVPGLKLSQSQVVARLGRIRGTALYRFASTAPDAVFGMIERFAIECRPVRNGWLLAAHSKRTANGLRQRVRSQDRDNPVSFLDQIAVRDAVGSPVFRGGLFDPRGGHVQPMSFARGMARGAAGVGVQIFGESEVIRLDRLNGLWTAATERGSVTADHVVIATNGYTGPLTPDLRRSMVAVHSLVIATIPLGDTDVIASDLAVSDTKRLLWYFRKDASGRLVFGGQGRLAEPRGPDSYMRVMNGLRDVFPQLEMTKFDFHWGGRVAVNRSKLPQINRPDTGMTSIVGFNGRGVALATAIGPAVAAIALGEEPDDVSPVPVTQMPAISFHGLAPLYAGVASRYYELRGHLS